MAEWLRRQTRNLLGFSRTGSNPVRSEFFFIIKNYNNIELLFYRFYNEYSVVFNIAFLH